MKSWPIGSKQAAHAGKNGLRERLTKAFDSGEKLGYTLIVATKQKRPGRPSIPPAKRRSIYLTVRVTAGEFRKLSARAEASDMTVSSYGAQLIKQGLERWGHESLPENQDGSEVHN